MSIRLRHILVEFISALLILLFVYTATSKALDIDSFRAVIGKSALIARFNYFLSYGIPLAEYAIAFFLMVPRFRVIGFALSFILLSIFTLYVGYMVLFVHHLPCSCGGVLKKLSWRQHLQFNMAFTVLSLCGYGIEKMNKRFIAINRISRTPV
jgi:hypothetical protein